MTAGSLRTISLVALMGAALTLAACGGSDSAPAPPGSPENPLTAQPTPGAASGAASRTRSNEAAAQGAAQPGYQKLVERQSRHPRSSFTPCNLVTAAQAQAIVGARMRSPLEAAQGPTCIYRSQNGKSFVTLAVQSLDFEKIKPRIRLRHRVDVSNRTAYCGTYGQPMLYVPLSRGRVLVVGAHCDVARQFAVHAVRQLSR